MRVNRWTFASRAALRHEVDRLTRILNLHADGWSRRVHELNEELRRAAAREAQLRALFVRRCAHCEAGRPRYRGFASLPAMHPLPAGGHARCGLTDHEHDLLFGIDHGAQAA